MWQHMCAWCQYTRGRFERTHGKRFFFFESTHGWSCSLCLFPSLRDLTLTCVDSKTLPCVHSKRLRVSWLNVLPAHTERRRFECTHGCVLNLSTGVFSVPQTQHALHTQQQHNNNNTIWGGLRFNRRGGSTPLWGVEAWSPPSRRPNPIPAIPPYVVRTPHLHGAPTTEETVKL